MMRGGGGRDATHVVLLRIEPRECTSALGVVLVDKERTSVKIDREKKSD